MDRKMIPMIFLLALLAGAAMAAGLAVSEAVICTGVQDRAPVGAGDSFFTDVGTLFCFTRITGGAEGTTVSHVWFFNEKQVAAVELKVGSSNWRTWSSKRIKPGDVGAWKVEVRDREGKTLKTIEFKTSRREATGSTNP